MVFFPFASLLARAAGNFCAFCMENMIFACVFDEIGSEFEMSLTFTDNKQQVIHEFKSLKVVFDTAKNKSDSVTSCGSKNDNILHEHVNGGWHIKKGCLGSKV